MALTEPEFSALKTFASVTDWKKIQRIAPFIITRLEAANYIEVSLMRSHARITQLGRQAHKEAHILRGKGEAAPTLIEEMPRFGRIK